MSRRNCFGMKDEHRGWRISQGPDDNFYAYGPNYDASYEGPEDGWVGNGEHVEAATYDALIEEIDNWCAEAEAADRKAVLAPFKAVDEIFAKLRDPSAANSSHNRR